MTSYQCEKCGRVFDLDNAPGYLCPVCATPATVAPSPAPARITDPEKCASIYEQALGQKRGATTYGEWETAGKLFLSISGYKDADALAAECLTLAETASREATYQQAMALSGNTAAGLRNKVQLLRSIAGYRDADALAAQYAQRAEALDAENASHEQEKETARQAEETVALSRTRRSRKVVVICAAIGVVAVAVALILSLVVMPAKQYGDAVAKFDAGEYAKAADVFSGILRHKDSETYLQKCYYHMGQASAANEDYTSAIDYLKKAGEIEDAPAQLAAVRETVYDRALRALDAGEFARAQEDFDAVGGYEDAKKYKQFCRAVRYWNGDSEVEAQKVDLEKAEDILWRVLDGTWYSEEIEQEFTIDSGSKGTDAPALKIVDNTLQWSADGTVYTVKVLSKTTLTLEGNGDYAGRYEKA